MCSSGAKHNVVRQQSFSDRLLALMRRYTNENLTAAEVIAELIAMAKEVAADADRGKRFKPALDPNELAFYDAVAAKDSVVVLMGEGDLAKGEEKLAAIARDLVKAVRRNLSVDWTAPDDVQAAFRSTIKRLLARHGYPPEEERDAIDQSSTNWTPSPTNGPRSPINNLAAPAIRVQKDPLHCAGSRSGGVSAGRPYAAAQWEERSGAMPRPSSGSGRPTTTEAAVGRITGRLAAVFRRSGGENRPRRSVPAAPGRIVAPRPPAPAVADGYVAADGVRFAPVMRSEELVAAVATQPRIALRLPTKEYGTVMGELIRLFDASEYGDTSPEYRAFRHAALTCAGCGWEFPGSYTGSLLGMFDGATVVGGTTGFAKFGRTGKCPRCGSRDSFLLYERIDPNAIDEDDVAALAGLWRDDALRWWSRTGRNSAICDNCNRDMRARDGYFISMSRLVCEPCLHDHLRGALEKLRANPYYYGSTELRRALPFRTGRALPEGGAPGAYGIEHVLVVWDGSEPDAAELKDLVESVMPGSTTEGMRLNMTDSPGLSRGLAYWHIHSDEVAGRSLRARRGAPGSRPETTLPPAIDG